MLSGPDIARCFSRIVFASLFLFVDAVCAPWAAADEGQSAIRWSGQADLSLMDFDYREYDDAGRLLDRESGTIPGVVLDLVAAMDRWALGGLFSWHANDVLYDGHTTTDIPIRTRTQENIVDTSVRIERRLGSAATSGLTLYGGFGYRYWGREIRPTYTSSGQAVDGLFEMYNWKYFFFGGNTAVYRTGRSRWGLDVRVLRPYRPTVEVDFRGRNDNIILDLGERTGWRVAFPWEYRTDQRTRLVVEPYGEGWDMGRSPTATLTQYGVPVTNVYEPRSTTRNTGLAVGIRHIF